MLGKTPARWLPSQDDPHDLRKTDKGWSFLWDWRIFTGYATKWGAIRAWNHRYCFGSEGCRLNDPRCPGGL